MRRTRPGGASVRDGGGGVARDAGGAPRRVLRRRGRQGGAAPAVLLRRPLFSSRCSRWASRATSTSRRWRHVPRRRRDAPRRRWGPPRASAPFTHFLKTRPDHLWHAPPPILSRLPAARVALRARVLVGHVRVSSDAMSWHGCGLRDGDLRPLCEDGVASLKPDGANACLVLDDQVALVPACAADAFFFTGRGTPRGAHECETQPEDASDLRLTWNEKTSVSFPRPLVTLGLCAGVSTPRSSSMCSLSRRPNRRSASCPRLNHGLHAIAATPDSLVDLRTGVGRRARRRVEQVSKTQLLGRRARDRADEALRPAAPPPRHRGVPRAHDRSQAQSGGLPRARALFFLQRERRGISLVSFVYYICFA